MIIVFGSLSVDFVTRVKRIPAPGETVLGGVYEMIPGGKGANQALAARRAGADVAFIGAVGPDSFAEPAQALMRADGIDLSGVVVAEAPTGAAFIAVDDNGENAIVVASGANTQARAEQLDARPMGSGDWMLLQRETPPAQVEAAAARAKNAGARVVLNLAPAGPPGAGLLALLDVLIVNEHEALTLGDALGLTTRSPEEVARHVDAHLNVATIVTLGAAGAVAWAGGVRDAAPAPAVNVIDTTGAGDTFVGAFGAALDRGLSFGDAMRQGLAAGSLACTRIGAQPGIPRRAEIEALLAAQPK